jgi:transketolase
MSNNIETQVSIQFERYIDAISQAKSGHPSLPMWTAHMTFALWAIIYIIILKMRNG